MHTDFGSVKAKCLMNAEVALILEHKREAMQAKGIHPKRYGNARFGCCLHASAA